MAIQQGAKVTKGQDVYIIAEKLAEGGFGAVFRATKGTGIFAEEFAVKVPKPAILAHPVWSKKFEREARILANVNHRNIVRIHDFWKFPDGEMALVQEFVPGARNLIEYLALPEADLASVVLQGLWGLRAIHQTGTSQAAVVHRDLSPRNVLVDHNGNVRIIDFGLAKEDPRLTEILTVTGEWFGTPGCIAPEQALEAADVDGRADLYAFGRALTAAMQGRKPEHADPYALPEPWRTFTLKLTQHDAAGRHQSADEAIDHLMKLLTGAGLFPRELAPHASEVKQAGMVLQNWIGFCNAYFKAAAAAKSLSEAHVVAASKLDAMVFSSPGFDAAGLFDELDSQVIVPTYLGTGLSYDDADPLGDYLETTYLALDPARRERCFQRLVRLAVDYHRYRAMGDTRRVFSRETDPQMQARLVGILDQEDPDQVIEGRGVFPRTP